MYRKLWLAGLVSLLGLGSALAQEKQVVKETTTVITTQEPDVAPVYTIGSREAAADLLRQRVASVNWNGATFEEVLDWVKDQGEGRVNVVPKWAPLGIEGVNRESTIDLQLNNTTIADVMNEVLDQLTETGEIQYRGMGNKLTISTKQDFERKMYIRVYNITDMLFRVEDFGESAPLIDLQNAGRSGGGSGGQSVFSGSSSNQRGESSDQLEQENEERLNKLRTVIEQTIAPETWDLSGSDNQGGGSQPVGGGGRGRIRVLNNSLIVLNTIEVHEMIAGAFSFTD